MTLSREERETIIRRDDVTDTWAVYTCSPVMKRKLDRIAEAWGVSPRRVDKWGWEYTLPDGAVSFRRPRVLSAEHKAKLVENLAMAR